MSNTIDFGTTAVGATKDEVVSAILVGLPAAGHRVTQSLPAVIEAYQTE